MDLIFWNETILISIQIPLKFVPKGPISNIPALILDSCLVSARQQAIIWTNYG